MLVRHYNGHSLLIVHGEFDAVRRYDGHSLLLVHGGFEGGREEERGLEGK